MSRPNALYESNLPSLGEPKRGKVRDLYDIDDQHLLIVTTDRISAFDVILPTPIPGKGKILTSMTHFWLNRSAHIVPNHCSNLSLEDVLANHDEREQILGRAQVVKKYKVLPIEAIIRGYITGSGWQDYQRHGMVCGIELPPNLQEADKLAQPLFTPSTKAEMGQHDENISANYAATMVGNNLISQIKQISLQLYTEAADYARQRGIIIADTKFEFGLADNGQVILIDEILTPDSSRFWPASEYAPGSSPPSYDKQYVRNYLNTLDWDKQAPGPELPKDVVNNTAKKYQEALNILTQG